MEIEEIKTWQWVVLGLIAGALFSAVVAWSGPAFDTQPRDTIEQGEFENSTFIQTRYGKIPGYMGMLIDEFHKDQPLLRDVTVHPPLSSDPNHYWVTGRVYSIGLKPVDPTRAGGPNKVVEEWKLFKYPAAVPYVPGYALREEKKLDKISPAKRNQEVAEEKKAFGGAASFPTVVDYLKAVQHLPDNDGFKFKYAWWELPGPKWTLPPVAGLLMIGVAWPLTLSAMQNYGIAKPPPVKAKPKLPEPAKQPVRTAMPAGVVIKAPTTAPPPPPLPGEQKKYGGEFYPVVKTTHKE